MRSNHQTRATGRYLIFVEPVQSRMESSTQRFAAKTATNPRNLESRDEWLLAPFQDKQRRGGAARPSIHARQGTVHPLKTLNCNVVPGAWRCCDGPADESPLLNHCFHCFALPEPRQPNSV